MKRPLAIPRGRAAAIFVDLQEEHRRDRRYLVEGFDGVIANVQRLQQGARRHGIPLYHSAYVVDLSSEAVRPFHPVLPDGSSAFSDKDHPMTAICPEVGPSGNEPRLVKSQASAFGDGVLAGQLRAGDVDWVIIAGVWTEACIAETVRDAIGFGFRVLLVKDACSSGTAAMHQTGVLNLANRLYGGAITDTEGACRLIEGDTVDVWMVDGAVPLRFTYENAAELYRDL